MVMVTTTISQTLLETGKSHRRNKLETWNPALQIRRVICISYVRRVYDDPLYMKNLAKRNSIGDRM